jgi:uncharacterized damage-inducible protein DinB
MSEKQVNRLSASLAESHAALLELLEAIDWELVIYSDPVWQVRDVIWHIAVWDRQVTQSIEAFQFGGQYAIPDFDEDKFNTASIEDSRRLSTEQILKASRQARKQFIALVQGFNEDQLESEFLYPWGDESGNVIQLVEYMVEHDEEHRREITSAAA